MKAIKCQLKMKCDMPGQTIQGLLEYVYSQPIIAGHPKQVSAWKSFHKTFSFRLLWPPVREYGVSGMGGTVDVFGKLGNSVCALTLLS